VKQKEHHRTLPTSAGMLAALTGMLAKTGDISSSVANNFANH
jgi:hypothetical protein